MTKDLNEDKIKLLASKLLEDRHNEKFKSVVLEFNEIDFFENDKLLLKSISSNNFSIVEFIVKRTKNLNQLNSYGHSPLFYSLGQQNYKISQFLVDNGANVNIQNRNGDTPLHIEAEGGFIDAINFLLKNGADINISNDENLLPIDLAISSKFFEAADISGAAGFVCLFDIEHPPTKDEMNYIQTVLEQIEIAIKSTNNNKFRF